MESEQFGYNERIHNLRTELKLMDFEIGRIVSEHKERYTVITEKGEFDAEITGNMRFTAKGREDFPAVGDWVALRTYEGGLSLIYAILPRFSMISRRASGQSGEIQLIAANIDYALLVQAADRDFNINRLERYLSICNSSEINPIIILSKTDLINEEEKTQIIRSIKQRIKNIPVFAISNLTLEGIDNLNKIFEKSKTYCLLGSSGVGKSTLLNLLKGKSIMKTDSISTATNKGRHITTYRELTVIENGAILIDNPGMREVGMTDNTKGFEATFDSISVLSEKCRFKDCTHTTEIGCAVIEAIENGEMDKDSYENYLKLQKEKAHFESSVAEKRHKDKNFGKMLKNYKKNMRDY